MVDNGGGVTLLVEGGGDENFDGGKNFERRV